MRAVVDTNILVSGLMHRGSPPGAVLQAIAQRAIQPVVCASVMEEYRTVLHRPRLRLRPSDVLSLLALIERLADWVNVAPYNGHPPLPDPDDWPFVACAMAIECVVITGNLRHFPPEVGVRVMTAREWVST